MNPPPTICQPPPCFRARGRTMPVVCALLLATACATVCGEDVVLLKPGGGLRRLTGTVTEYTGQELFLRRRGGQETSIPADRVAAVQTEQTQPHQEADRLLQADRPADALESYQRAMKTETRTWVQREILAQIVVCLAALDRVEQAAGMFQVLLRSDPTTRHFRLIPLPWRASPLSPTLAAKAKGWTEDQRSSTRLLGAGWLLTADTSQRGAAIRTLQQLAGDRDERVAALAAAQLWRTQIVTAGAADLEKWQRGAAADAGGAARRTDLRAGAGPGTGRAARRGSDRVHAGRDPATATAATDRRIAAGRHRRIDRSRRRRRDPRAGRRTTKTVPQVDRRSGAARADAAAVKEARIA